MPRKIEVSHKTIIFTVLFLVFVWFLYLIRDIILEFFVALLIMTILNPLVTALTKLKIPRGISVLSVYILILIFFGVAVASVLPPLVEQTTSFANGLPKYLEVIGVTPVVSQELIGEFLSRVGNLPGQVIRLLFSALSNFLAVVTTLIFAFYLLLTRDRLEEQLGFFFGEEKKKELGRLIDLLEERLGGWARGQLSLMVLVGAAMYIGLLILGIPFALPLALLAGILEIIPYIGPIIAAVPAVIIGFGISPFMGITVAVLAFIIQQLESYLFVPKVMEKAVGVSPIVTLLALAIGARMAGLVGVVISVPLLITLQVLTRELILKD